VWFTNAFTLSFTLAFTTVIHQTLPMAWQTLSRVRAGARIMRARRQDKGVARCTDQRCAREPHADPIASGSGPRRALSRWRSLGLTFPRGD